MQFFNKNEKIVLRFLSKDVALDLCDEIVSIINLIPHIQCSIEELFKEQNSDHSKWESSIAAFNLNGEIIGVLLAYYRKKDERHDIDSLYIHRFSVRKDYQNRGIGTKMMRYFLEYNFKNRDLKNITIQTNKELKNQYVIEFYRKIGFKDKYLIAYPDKLDILMMITCSEYYYTFN